MDRVGWKESGENGIIGGLSWRDQGKAVMETEEKVRLKLLGFIWI